MRRAQVAAFRSSRPELPGAIGAAALAAACLEAHLSAELEAALADRPPLAWIGSGLSRIAAELGARAWQRAGGAGTVFTPLEYCVGGAAAYTPVLITYGGGNLDSQSTARQIAARRPSRVVLITGCPGSPCERLLTASGSAVEVVVLPEHPRERRFVAVLPLLAMAGLALRLALPRGERVEARAALTGGARRAASQRARLRDRILSSPDWRDRRWIALAGGMTSVAALAWQAVLSEAALADVVVADLKDYSHGRYMSALQRDDMAYLVLSDERCHNLGRTVCRRFGSFFPVAHVQLGGGPLEAAWGHLVLAAALVEDLCLAAGWDLTAPPRPEVVRSWSNWGQVQAAAQDGGRS